MSTDEMNDDAVARGDTPDAATTEAAAAAAAAAPEAAAPEAAAPRDDAGRFIPKARFDEAVLKEREARQAAERRLDELSQQLNKNTHAADMAAVEEEIQALEKQHAAALIDGEVDTAAALRKEIRDRERALVLAQSENMSANSRAQAAEDIRIEMAINTLETTYPVLNPNDESYDQGVVDMIIGMQRTLIEQQRMTPAAAMVKASQDVMARLMPAKAEAATPAGLAAAAGDKTAAQVRKNLDTAGKQPASASKVGADTDAGGTNAAGMPDTTKLRSDDLDKIPEATLRRLRGDDL